MQDTQKISEHNLFAGRLTERRARLYLKRQTTAKLEHSVECLEGLGGPSPEQQAVLDFYKEEVTRRYDTVATS